MIGLLFLLFLIWIAYKLLVQGYLFKLMIFFGFVFCAPIVLALFIPASLGACMTFAGYSFSWALILPLIIAFISLLYMRTN